MMSPSLIESFLVLSLSIFNNQNSLEIRFELIALRSRHCLNIFGLKRLARNVFEANFDRSFRKRMSADALS